MYAEATNHYWVVTVGGRLSPGLVGVANLIVK